VTHLSNDADTFKDDLMDGLVASYSRYVERVPDASGVQRRGGPVAGKVSLIIGGGSGHYPAFAGTVGAGLAAAAVVGDVFTSPSTEQAYRVGRALDGGAGVLFSFGNYAGDVMNFGVAEQRLRADGIDCRTVLVTDDVASADVGELEKRRGIAGDFVVFKVAGAAAERGDDLDSVERIARHANDRTRTLGVAFAGCTVPGADEPLFTVEPGQMEVGLGIHGEPGVSTTDVVSARDLVPLLLDPLLQEQPDDADGRVAVIVNGLGATKYEELFCLSASLFPALEERGLTPVLPEVGELVTSLDMAGCSLTLCWLDDALEELWSAPADTPAFRRGEISQLGPSGADSTAKVEPQATEQADEPSVEPDETALACARTVHSALQAMRDVVVEGEQELGRIDAVAGDGDHGSGMARGLRAAVEAADDSVDAGRGPGTVLRTAGAALADKAGGTSGVLWGAMLTALGDRIGDETAPDDETLVAGIGDAAEAVQRLGQCEPGDKTMLDALLPFVETLAERLEAGDARQDAWHAAAGKADEAAQATAELAAKVGRARPLAERSIGTPDPGAVSMAWCLKAVAEHANL
jgi:dihydroxyacetone kinase